MFELRDVAVVLNNYGRERAVGSLSFHIKDLALRIPSLSIMPW